MSSLFSKISATTLQILICFFALAAIVSAQSVLGPSAPPPFTTSAPVTSDSVFQDKSGSFTARHILADTAFCMGADCRTSWAQAGAAVCKLETRRVDTPQHFVGSCFNLLTPQAKAAGWAASGEDACSNIASSDCFPPTTCIYTRLVCSGTASIDPTVHEGPLNFPVPGFTTGTQYVCSNVLDDDADGKFDYPADPDCSSPFDGTEAPATPRIPGGPRGGAGGGATN